MTKGSRYAQQIIITQAGTMKLGLRNIVRQLLTPTQSIDLC